MVHVPYKGSGQSMQDLLGGQHLVAFDTMPASAPHVRSGKLRALAVSSSKRLAQLPDVPTLTELGYAGMEDYTWVGVFAPAGTPADVVQKLNEAIVRIAHDPEIKKRLDALAFEVTAAPLRETSDYVKSEVAKWARVVRDVGAKVD